MKGCNKISCLILLVSFPFVLCYSQERQYQFEQITTSHGLSGNSIYSVIQDSRDFVWIGTNRGLNCYNGYEITRFNRPKDTIQLSKGLITCLFEDTNGIIWIGTSKKGLYAYDPVLDKFDHYSHDPEDSSSLTSNEILSIYQDKNGIIWFGTEGSGLNRYNTETETFTAFLPVPEQPGHNKNTISSMIEDNEGTFWIGTYEGVYHFDRNAEKFLPFEKKPDIPDIYQQIFCFHKDIDGNIWFGTLKGLFKYVIEERELIHIISGNDKNIDHLRDDVIVSIQGSKTAGKEVLWIATRKGLVKYDLHNDRFSRYVIDPTTPKSLSNNYINNLCLNDNGILWIGTAWSGVNKIDTRGNPFIHVQLKLEDEELFYSASSFFMDKKGYLWVGACTGGIFKFDPQLKKVAQYQYSAEKGFFIDASNPFTNWIDFIYGDSDNVLWIGLGGWGPAIFDRERESFIFLEFNLPEGHPRPERMQDILEDQYGTIWFGTWGSGLFKKDRSDGKHDPVNIVHHKILMHAIILEIFEDSQKNLYFGTAKNGLFCLEAKNRGNMQFTQYGSTESESPGLYTTYIEKIYEDINGTIWVASQRGLNKFNPEKQQFELIHDTTGLIGDGIRQVFGDDKGNLWLSHITKGLIRYQPDSRKIKIYNRSDGMPFDDMVKVYWYQSDDGRIFIPGYFSDGNGFLYFHPDSISDNKHIPKIVISDFKIENKPFPVDSSISAIKHIKLKYNQNFFSFQFAALDYANPEKNQYAHFLEGLDEAWIYSGNRRYANYTSVPPGEYVFHVKGSNNDGYWNEEGVAVKVSILPPPWKTWWAYFLYLLFIISILYIVIRFYLRRQRLLHKLELEQIQTEKLEELDSMKSRFFANISHEFRTPLTLILGPLEKLRSKVADQDVEQDFNMMQRNARRLQNLINQLLNISKLESGKMKLQTREENIVALVNGYVQSFESLAKQKNIDLNFKSSDNYIPLFVDKDKIEKILFNLLSNAFKFTGEGGRINVRITSTDTPLNPPSRGDLLLADPLSKRNAESPPFRGDGRGVYLQISDTGRGISPEKLEHIFDRFYQADDSYTRDQEGTGIGLALTKELVEIHHGNIQVESDPDSHREGKGTTFTVFLPAGKDHLKPEEIVDKTEVSTKREEPTASIPALEYAVEELKPELQVQTEDLEKKEDKPFLLIIDDNADLRTYIRGYLDPYYYISEARDGEEGLHIATEKIPDLVISDVMMPKMDGYELCRKLKTDELTSHVPVILLTARAALEDKLEGLETGADDFICKPFNGPELQVRVRNLITLRKRLRERYRNEFDLIHHKPADTIPIIDRQFLEKAKKVVNIHLSDPDFSVAGFASEMALSRVQLHRKLKAIIDQPAGDFIRIIRLGKALEMLQSKSGNISEIAYDTGFSSPSYFSECFRHEFGLSPTEYQSKNSKK